MVEHNFVLYLSICIRRIILYLENIQIKIHVRIKPDIYLSLISVNLNNFSGSNLTIFYYTVYTARSTVYNLSSSLILVRFDLAGSNLKNIQVSTDNPTFQA
jgi:hypothetical protein